MSSINALFSSGGVARCLAAIRDSPKTLYAFLIVSAVPLVRNAMPFVDRRNVFAWDMLLLSGFATLAVGLVLARSGPRRLERMLERLVRRGVLITVEPLSDIKTDLEQKTRVWRTAGAVIVATCVLISFLTLITMNWRTPRAGSLLRLGLFETAWAYVVGGYLGSMAANGKVGWYLKRKSASVWVSPGHIDGAAGLKPFGDFCLYQAMVVAIPGVFLAVWTFLIPAWPELTMRQRYIQWMHPYMALLAATLVIEVMAFLIPMWWFHREMRDQKDQLLVQADELSSAIARIRTQLAGLRTSAERKELDEQLSFITKQYWDIEHMPTWPVDVSTIRKFTFRNAALIMPLIAEVSGLHENWVKLLQESLGKITVATLSHILT